MRRTLVVLWGLVLALVCLCVFSSPLPSLGCALAGLGLAFKVDFGR